MLLLIGFPTLRFQLNSLPNIRRDDCFVVVLYVYLFYRPLIFDSIFLTISACSGLTISFPCLSRSYPIKRMVLMEYWPASNRFRIPHVLFSEIDRISSCAREDRIVNNTSPLAASVYAGLLVMQAVHCSIAVLFSLWTPGNKQPLWFT